LNTCIVSAFDVDSKLLFDFYDIVYPDRKDTLLRIWKWLYRTDSYKYKTPFVILDNGRVIAHASLIPFTIKLGNKYYTAVWFVDIAVLPEFQRLGLGAKLAEKRMEFSDIYVTLCNKRSFGVHRKMGWIQSHNSYLHFFPILPFNHPGFKRRMPFFLCRVLNQLSSPIYEHLYNKYSTSLDKIEFKKVDKNMLDRFKCLLSYENCSVYTVRDSDYFLWRILNSPDKKLYRIINTKGVSTIIKLCDNYYSKYIDVLLVSDLSDFFTLRTIISNLAVWGKERDYNFIRFYTSGKDLSSFLKKSLKPFVKYPIFAYYSKDELLLEKLKRSKWNWGLIDSDFEKF